MPITIQEANRVIEGARRKAEEKGIALSFAVVDNAGHVVAIQRMDGARWPTVDIARGKAYTSAAWGMETSAMQLVQSQETMPAFIIQAAQLTAGLALNADIQLPVGGGLPIRRGNELLGAIGVSGSSSQNDIECAQAGIKEL